jgi:retron-type reverse transcriptase
VRDGVLLRLIDKWLKAGVLDEGCVTHPEAGSPQGGVVSPMLSNVVLHSVLDEWFVREVQPRLKGHSFLIRYADDCAPRRCERTTSGVSLNAMLRER